MSPFKYDRYILWKESLQSACQQFKLISTKRTVIPQINSMNIKYTTTNGVENLIPGTGTNMWRDQAEYKMYHLSFLLVWGVN